MAILWNHKPAISSVISRPEGVQCCVLRDCWLRRAERQWRVLRVGIGTCQMPQLERRNAANGIVSQKQDLKPVQNSLSASFGRCTTLRALHLEAAAVAQAVPTQVQPLDCQQSRQAANLHSKVLSRKEDFSTGSF